MSDYESDTTPREPVSECANFALVLGVGEFLLCHTAGVMCHSCPFRSKYHHDMAALCVVTSLTFSSRYRGGKVPKYGCQNVHQAKLSVGQNQGAMRLNSAWRSCRQTVHFSWRKIRVCRRQKTRCGMLFVTILICALSTGGVRFALLYLHRRLTCHD